MISLLFLIPVTILNGVVVMKLWAWHILTVFPQLGPLSFSKALSLSFFIRYFTTHIKKDPTPMSPDDEFASGMFGLFVLLILLLFGWLLHEIQILLT